ncbi:MAG: FHA domain-containing protein [Acidimicrobiales bacterium]|nr:FHA domain-containing protein [Acidimicrobiales bacterium]
MSPNPRPGWLRCPLSPRPSLAVTPAGAPVPAVSPDSIWDLEAGVVRGGGFLLLPAVWVAAEPDAGVATPARARTDTVHSSTAVLPVGRPADQSLPVDVTAAMSPDADETSHAPDTGPPETGSPETGPPEEETTATAGASVSGEEPGAQPAPQRSLDLRSPQVRQHSIPYPPLPVGGGPDRAVAGAPVVAGVICPRGHLNRPGMTGCVRCGSAIPAEGSYSVSGTRPALGCLVVDDHNIYRLDRGYLVGSNPGRDPTVRGGLALPLTLRGQDVSATHAEIRLHDWDVLLTDRSSAGGTCVYEPDAGDWERLRPFEPRLLKPGTHIAFGQRVATFVTPWIPGQPGS